MKKNNIIKFPNWTTTVSLMGMAQELRSLKDEKRAICEAAARSILKALDLKDQYTFGHSMRVAYYSLIIGKELELNPDELYELELSALFHDIGKIGTPDLILNKASRLTDDEFLIMKKHPELSFEVLNEFSEFQNIAINAKHHHERFDGRGYPSGFKGEEIPLASRIILIADTFDAMTSSRTYRQGLAHEVAYGELLEFSGTQFDGNLVKAFISGMEKEKSKNEDEFFISIMDKKYNKKAA